MNVLLQMAVIIRGSNLLKFEVLPQIIPWREVTSVCPHVHVGVHSQYYYTEHNSMLA